MWMEMILSSAVFLALECNAGEALEASSIVVSVFFYACNIFHLLGAMSGPFFEQSALWFRLTVHGILFNFADCFNPAFLACACVYTPSMVFIVQIVVPPRDRALSG